MTVFSSPTEQTMEEITRVGIDLGKKVFHVTAVDAAGAVVERRRLRRAGLRSYLALLPRGRAVAMEACGSASHWGRLAAWHGHRPLLMSPQHVTPYVTSNKNDANDADAIAEASARPQRRGGGADEQERANRVGGAGAQGIVRREPRGEGGVTAQCAGTPRAGGDVRRRLRGVKRK